MVTLLAAQGFEVSVNVITQLLKRHNYRRRTAQKSKATGTHPQRNEQLEPMERLITQYQQAGHAILSMDTTQKEFLGLLYRDGYLYTQHGAIKVYDHDWRSLATGVAIPNGLYDIVRNEGYIQIGNTHDISEFACDSIRHWWTHHGCVHYPDLKSLLLCDGGGRIVRAIIFSSKICKNFQMS